MPLLEKRPKYHFLLRGLHIPPLPRQTGRSPIKNVSLQNRSGKSDKLVVLKLDGGLNQGFRVTLEFRGEFHPLKIKGYLPPDPELAVHLQRHWQEKYRPLGRTRQIKRNKTINARSVNEPLWKCRESAEELRERFRTWLNSESFHDIDRRLREEFNRDEAIRFLIFTEETYLQKLPWQEWDFFERYPKAEVAVVLNATYEQQPKLSTKTTRTAKVRILAILGHSEGIDIEADRQLLENLPDAETVFLVEPQRQQINDLLWEQPWDIIFFAGHSMTEGETGRIYINQTDSLSINELCYALKKALGLGLKLAILNSCDGLGLAKQLNDLQIPQIIVMRDLVPDQVAQEFLKYFLNSFSSGESFYVAAREARERLQRLEDQFPCATWLPVIFQNPAEVPPTWQDLREVRSKPVGGDGGDGGDRGENSSSSSPPSEAKQRPTAYDRTPALAQASPPRSRRSLQKVLLASVVITILVMGISMLLIWGVAKLRDDSDQQKNSFIQFLNSFELVPKK